MACFLLRSSAGDRWMPEGVEYVFLEGEYIVPGQIDWKCGSQEDFDRAMDLTRLWTEEGFMVGNAIKKVTTFFRIPHCMACRGRQIAYNHKGLELQQKLKDLIS